MSMLKILSRWLALLLVCGSAAAHEIRPAVATLTLEPDGRYEIAVVVNIEAVIAAVSPQHRDTDESPNAREYNRLRALAPEALRTVIEAHVARYLDGIELQFDGTRVRPALSGIEIPSVGEVALSRQTTMRLGGAAPAVAKTLTFSYAARFGSCVIRVREGERLDAMWLKNGERSVPYVLGKGFDQRTMVDVLLEYTVVGFTHIVPKGLDHILFVLGLFLLSVRLAPLLIQVTAFTVAHTLTLALSVYGVVSLGFAGVLQEVGLPHGQFVPALVSFNVGVELGQLAVIALAYLAVGIWGRNKTWYRPRVVIPASATVAAVGLFWTVQRVLGS